MAIIGNINPTFSDKPMLRTEKLEDNFVPFQGSTGFVAVSVSSIFSQQGVAKPEGCWPTSGSPEKNLRPSGLTET